MKKKSGKYIVYVDQEYFQFLCDKNGVKTRAEGDVFFHKLMDEVSNFIKGKGIGSVLFTLSFIDKNGNRRKSIEVTPLLSADNPKTLHYIRKINNRKKR
ncbi:hypothetical protein [Bacteroides sp.]|uniref:hypothetical protein n=1 Tax=Bacteroides sp. TaxID=29523 RepID=UPI0026297AFB|nr:hypothetical protein [Bacteroides sp.]MDD3037910.1 hypothetical protein [Bacteroides sp.]